MISFVKKLLICLSQLVWIVPGSALAYVIAGYIENKKFFNEGYDLGKLFFILAAWIICCALFIPVWILFVKKTGISSTKEYRELQEAMKK